MNIFLGWAGRLVRAVRVKNGEPPTGFRQFVRITLHRFRRRGLRLIDAVFGEGAGARFNVAVLRASSEGAGLTIVPTDVMRRETVESLVSGADEYYRSAIANGATSFLKRKPFHSLDETPQVLVRLGWLLHGAHLTTGLHVVEYGGGSGWLSALIWQMGCHVTCVDASAAALELAHQAFEEHRHLIVWPGAQCATALTDGHTLPLPDASMDRIVCLNAFHHVPNPADVLKEMARVLRPGGIAGFSEPGAGHSRTAQAQYEMRNYTVIENDIVIEDIERWALDSGFGCLELAVVDPRSYRVDWREYTELIAGGVAAERYVDTIREAAASRRLFFLRKPGETPADSRQRRGLAGSVKVALDATQVSRGGTFSGEASVANTGANIWLPSNAPLGPVFLGIHLFAPDGQLINRDFGRIWLPHGLRPEESATFRFTFDAPPAGEYRLGFDLVSEHVCWFEMNGADVVSVDISVR